MLPSWVLPFQDHFRAGGAGKAPDAVMSGEFAGAQLSAETPFSLLTRMPSGVR
ncbi:hypothetical protein ACU4GD_11590 [Cupriavidus basilensis]